MTATVATMLDDDFDWNSVKLPDPVELKPLVSYDQIHEIVASAYTDLNQKINQETAIIKTFTNLIDTLQVYNFDNGKYSQPDQISSNQITTIRRLGSIVMDLFQSAKTKTTVNKGPIDKKTSTLLTEFMTDANSRVEEIVAAEQSRKQEASTSYKRKVVLLSILLVAAVAFVANKILNN